jgi:hypothetical protein
MSEFDWRLAQTYAGLEAADAADFAWEFLRRNREYRVEYDTLRRGATVELIAKFRERWGCSFPADPNLAFNAQSVFWAPEFMPTVLNVADTSWKAASPSYRLDLTTLSGNDLRQASDGWHALVRLKGITHRLFFRTRPTKGNPISVELALDADFATQSRAALSLWSALHKRPMGRARPTLTLQRRHRLALVVRALDGRLEGNTYRVVAGVLFGKERASERAWKSNDLRTRTMRLVESGLSLMRGGYRALLRGEPSN